MGALVRAVAGNVRRLRESQSMSLRQLATRAGLAKSTLSQIEAGSANPTVTTLEDLASALSVHFEDLIHAEPEDEVELVRAGTGQDASGEHILGRMVKSATVSTSILEFHVLDIEPGTTHVSPSHGGGSREYVYVVSGSLRLGPSETAVAVNAGDFAVYPADRLHLWKTSADNAARVVIVAVFPTI